MKHVTLVAVGVIGLMGSTAVADTLYDNGPPNGDNGYSNTTGGILDRRTLLDDFVVPDGESWCITGFRWENIGDRGIIGVGEGLEILFRSDAAGAPGVPITGLAKIASYTEIATGRTWFGQPGFESWATFDAITLGPGHYWLEATIVIFGGLNNFWLITGNEIFNNVPCYVNYDDFPPPLQPGINIFGVNADLNFVIEGEVISSCPQDLDGSGAVDFGDILLILAAWGNAGGPEDLDGNGVVDFGDLLIVLAAWGPCE